MAEENTKTMRELVMETDPPDWIVAVLPFNGALMIATRTRLFQVNPGVEVVEVKMVVKD